MDSVVAFCVDFHSHAFLSACSGEKGSPGEIRTYPGDPGQKGEKGLSGNPGPEGENRMV